jgi:large subunit ribosomal protein L10
MPNVVNRLVVQELTKAFQDAEGMLVVSFGGLTVKESEGLRTKMAEKGVKMRMVRNSLARRVLKDRGLELDEKTLLGNTAIAYGNAEAAIHAAKLCTSAEVKKAGKITVRAGVLEGQVLGAKDAVSLADVPDRNTINAKLLGCISGPARGLVSVLNGTPNGLVRVIKARADQLEAAGGGTPA